MEQLAKEIAQKLDITCPDSGATSQGMPWQANQHMLLLEPAEAMDTGTSEPPPSYGQVQSINAIELQRSPCIDEMVKYYKDFLISIGMGVARVDSLDRQYRGNGKEILIKGYAELRQAGMGVSWRGLYNKLLSPSLQNLREQIQRHYLR